MRLGPESPDQAEAVDARHHDVDQDEIGRETLENLQGFGGIIRPPDPVACGFENLANNIPEGLLIIHHQNAGSRACISRPSISRFLIAGLIQVHRSFLFLHAVRMMQEGGHASYEKGPGLRPGAPGTRSEMKSAVA